MPDFKPVEQPCFPTFGGGAEVAVVISTIDREITIEDPFLHGRHTALSPQIAKLSYHNYFPYCEGTVAKMNNFPVLVN